MIIDINIRDIILIGKYLCDMLFVNKTVYIITNIVNNIQYLFI